jgi:hypothetical protein
MLPPNRKLSVIEWSTVEFQQVFLTQDTKDLLYEINLVCTEMRTIGHTLPCPDYARTLSQEVLTWANLIAQKSPLIQAMMSCHNDIFLACSRINELVVYTQDKYASRGNGTTKPVYPEIVVITDDNSRTLLYLIESLFDHIAGPNHDKLDWIRGQSNILWQSDNFKRLLYNSYAEWMKHSRQVLMEAMYPWFARFTENIIRDAPSQKDIYMQAFSQYLRLSGLSRNDLMKWHFKAPSFHSPLVQDLIEDFNRNGEDDDLPFEQEAQSVKTKSSDKTATTRESDKSKKSRESTPSKRAGEKSGRTDDSFVYNNPVADTPMEQGALGFTNSSGLNLSALNQTKGSEVMTDRERELRRELADIEAAKLRTTPVYQPPLTSASSMGFQAIGHNLISCGKVIRNRNRCH